MDVCPRELIVLGNSYEELHNDQAWYYLYERPADIVKF